jgi:hypothetical protein
LDSNNYDITAAGNWADAGAFSAGTATVTLDGGSANQSVTTGSSAFYNLTSTNISASPGVTFTNGTNVSNLFKDVTPASILTFTAGTTSTLADIQLHGAANPNYVTIRSTGAAANWHVTKTAPQNDVSYVSVSYNNASGSGDYIDATNGTNNNGGNNDSYWHFPVTLSIAGTIYQAGVGETTPDTTGYQIFVSVDNAVGVGITVPNGNSTYSITPTVSAGKSIAVYIKGDTNNANAFTVTDGSTAITGLNLYI